MEQTKKTLLCEYHMSDKTFTIDVLEKDGKYFGKWSTETDDQYHEVKVKEANYHHYANKPKSLYIVFGGWAFWLEDDINCK